MHEIFKLDCFALIDGKNELIEMDIAFIDGKPCGVAGYRVVDGKDVPRFFPLDPWRLKQRRNGRYQYEGLLVIPQLRDN